MSKYDFKWLSENGCWKRWFNIAKSLSKGKLPEATSAQLGRLKRLKREATEAAKTASEYERKLGLDMVSCPHPIELIEMESYGREDDYGSYLRGSTGSFKCNRCHHTLLHFLEDVDGNVTKRF